MKTEARKFYLGAGTVQPVISRMTPFYCKHFGRAEYDRERPVVSDSIRKQAQPIVDALNNGTMTIAEAEKKLDNIYL